LTRDLWSLYVILAEFVLWWSAILSCDFWSLSVILAEFVFWWSAILSCDFWSLYVILHKFTPSHRIDIRTITVNPLIECLLPTIKVKLEESPYHPFYCSYTYQSAITKHVLGLYRENSSTIDFIDKRSPSGITENNATMRNKI